jgi:tRNA pseudouridine55 synthase
VSRPATTAESGLVVVDKPPGITSHDVVARVRRIAGTRKVGHAGTLDPMATGVLLVGVNKATRLLGHLMLGTKEYDATLRLGESTTTDDAEGEVVARSSAHEVSETSVREAARGFVGDIDQVPSSVSAIKVDGQRAYAKVRAGESVRLAARRVHVESLEVTGVRNAGEWLDVDISVRCSSGTYVRALARDLGSVLGVGGHLTMLRRTSVGPFAITAAHPLTDLEKDLHLIPITDVARRCFPTYSLDDQQARDVGYGRQLEVDLGASGPVALFDSGGSFLALYEQRGGRAVASAVFSE